MTETLETRKPAPPASLVGALQDKVHVDLKHYRAARVPPRKVPR